ncbi:MAG: HNH endonuclease [Clostridiales Family XIII bacterium]|jgi:hypothetical protein|nr:HNH endonuclease [Clostridiales Family XIII bacterium]
MLEKGFVPAIPFAGFKWKWASVQCTEGLNDPVVLLGVLFRMRKLEGRGLKYSSPEFGDELVSLSNDIQDSVDINLAERVGERNLIRNSGQYWRALNLISADDHSGKIKLTEFGKEVADRNISQAEFAAANIRTFKLPNKITQTDEEYRLWAGNGIEIHPLKLILEILQRLERGQEDCISVDELIKIVIPLSACNARVVDYVNFITWYRRDEIDVSGWPDCCPGANDQRIAREFLLFLSNYGYINKIGGKSRLEERYEYNQDIDAEIRDILSGGTKDETITYALDAIRATDAVSEVERKRSRGSQNRPNQARFRREILDTYERCVITNVMMPEVLEAAHIKPFKYNGEDTVANGFPMRMDVHVLFDTGHLRISVEGNIELTNRARMDYGAAIPPRIVIPETINKDFLRWRWDNYDGI